MVQLCDNKYLLIWVFKLDFMCGYWVCSFSFDIGPVVAVSRYYNLRFCRLRNGFNDRYQYRYVQASPALPITAERCIGCTSL